MGDRLAAIDMGRKVGGLLCPFRGRGAGYPSNTMSPGNEAYLRTKWQLDPSSRLAAIDMSRKFGGCALFGGRLVTIEHSVAWDEAYLHTKWHLDSSSRLATIKMGRKLMGALPPFWGRGAVSPSSTMWTGPRPTCMPSVILIHPAVWQQ